MSAQNEPALPPAPLPLPPASPAAISLSPRYLLTVGGMIVLIIATLAALWVRERNRRVKAEQVAAQARQAIGPIEARVMEAELFAAQFREKYRQAIGQLMALATAPGTVERTAIQPFQRQDQVPVTVTLDGAKREAFLLPASGAARFGFREGDVIVVMPSPASAPTSAPATTGPGL